MNNLRPFRFGLLGPNGGSSRKEWIERVLAIEAAGYSSLLFMDHLGTAPIACMMAAAAATTTVKIGSCMFANDFRHPVFLAQEAAMIDLFSDGRLELGLGTGWYKGDYTSSGIPLDPPDVRVSRMEEAIHVIKGFFGGESFDFTGRYYNVHELKGLPRPFQKPHPPITIGGGSRRILSFAGREADIVSINIRTTRDGWLDFTSLSYEATAQKVSWVREAAGERFTELELNLLISTVNITDKPRQAAQDYLKGWELPADDVSVERCLQSPPMLIGSVDQVVEKLQICREQLGISYFTIFEPMEQFIPVVRLLAGK